MFICLIRRIICVFFTILLVFHLSSCQEDTPQKSTIRPVKTVVVGNAKTQILCHFPGRVLATDQATLAFEVPGKIVKLPVKEGDRLTSGQLIAQLDEHEWLSDPYKHRLSVVSSQVYSLWGSVADMMCI